MKIQVKFIADDGRVFDDENECKTYERLRLVGVHPGFVQAVRDTFSSLIVTGDRDHADFIPFDREVDDGREVEAVAIALVTNWEFLADAMRQARIDALGPEELSNAVVNSKRKNSKPKRNRNV